MATPDRNTTYATDGTTTTRTAPVRESNSTGWFVGIIVALALLAIGYLVFSANSGPDTTTTTVNNTPVVEAPASDPAMTTPMTEAPAAGADTAPMTEAPATDVAPATEAPAVDAAPATEAPATEAPAAVETAPAPGV